jgi:hypothetical protein
MITVMISYRQNTVHPVTGRTLKGERMDWQLVETIADAHQLAKTMFATHGAEYKLVVVDGWCYYNVSKFIDQNCKLTGVHFKEQHEQSSSSNPESE